MWCRAIMQQDVAFFNTRHSAELMKAVDQVKTCLLDLTRRSFSICLEKAVLWMVYQTY